MPKLDKIPAKDLIQELEKRKYINVSHVNEHEKYYIIQPDNNNGDSICYGKAIIIGINALAMDEISLGNI